MSSPSFWFAGRATALATVIAVAAAAPVGGIPAERAAEYAAEAPKTILELQQFRRLSRVAIVGPQGQLGTASLTEINPRIDAWFVLTLDWSASAGRLSYHLENPQPHSQRIELTESSEGGLRLISNGREFNCRLWTADGAAALVQAQRSALPLAPLCDGRLYLRNPATGHYTQLEKVTGFLRDHVWYGDEIVTFVRKEFVGDAFVEKGKPAEIPAVWAVSSADAPAAAMLNSSVQDRALLPEHLGIDVLGSPGGLLTGRWYAINGAPGIYVSAIQPEYIAPDILDSFPSRVSRLDRVEAGALDYLVAFDLAQFHLGFVLGTDHPRVDWSERVRREVREARLPGPDGIDGAAPLVRNGIVSPTLVAHTAAAFVGGFKRVHGAFHYGALAHQNHSSHYGFIEQGVVFSKLQPALTTLYVLDDGHVDMQTWSKEDDVLLERIKYARQNGVPLIETDAATGRATPGALVNQWGAGNWSGSADEKLRTLRAGICIQENGTRRFLIYGYFSTATPSAMVRVFQAYGCRYAMHLDMNALEHTYLALYTRASGRVVVQHLIDGMDVLDKTRGGSLAPRFLSFPDNRDFFYLVRKRKAP